MKVPSIRAPGDEPAASAPLPEREAKSEPAAATSQSRSPSGYFRQLWQAEVPLRRVFWQDMVVVGTTVNIAAMGLAILAVVLGASTPAGIAIHLAPVPYNILLVASVWRRADVERVDWGWLARLGSLLWLILAFVI